MLATITHIVPITSIQRTRLLPVPGRVVVRKGQKVSPTDVIAEANLAPEHLLLDIVRGLGLSGEDADRFIQHQAGDQVSEGDVIAGPVGFGRRVVRAPSAGKVVLAGSGQVLLEVESRPYEIRAGFSGIVSELIPDRGAILEATGALIQGVWGNGRIDYGLLNVQARTPDDVITADRLDVSLRGAVVLAGICTDTDVLNTAGDLPLRGLILASMNSSLVPLALKMRYPIIILEGFGQIPMNSIAYKLISTNARREVALNGETWNRYESTRPEIIIQLPAQGDLPTTTETDMFKTNQQVRVLCAPYRSKIGTLIAVRSGLTVLPNGTRVPAADIHLEDGENVILPLADLEVLE